MAISREARFSLGIDLVLVSWCLSVLCVNGAINWRSPSSHQDVQELTSDPPPYIVNKNTFQFVKNRITVSAKNYSVSIII